MTTQDLAIPSAIALEQGVIGLCLIQPADALPVCVEKLDAECFIHPACRAVWVRMTLLFDAGHEYDHAIITTALHGSGELDRIGGPMAIHDLMEAACLSTSLLDEYIDGLLDARQRRDLITAADELARMARDGGTVPTAAITAAQGALTEIMGGSAKDARPLRDVMMDVFRDIEQASKNRGKVTRGIPTGFADLDRQLMGIRGKYLYVIGARPSMGKSTLLVNIAENMALNGHPCLLFTLEMPDRDVGARMAVGGAGVDLQKSRSGMFSTIELSNIRQRMSRLSTSPMWIYDQPGLTIGEIRARARVMHQKHGLKAIFVDYLQLVKGESKRARENRWLEVGEVSKGLKQLAMELDVAVITAAQLNRGAEERRDHKPMMADLRESGDIEQDADFIGLLRRPGYYNKDGKSPDTQKSYGKRKQDHSADAFDREGTTDEPDDVAYLDIAKHRNGPVGECKFRFIDCQTRFIDTTKLYG
jgi:replicative DNA helicase